MSFLLVVSIILYKYALIAVQNIVFIFYCVGQYKNISVHSNINGKGHTKTKLMKLIPYDNYPITPSNTDSR